MGTVSTDGAAVLPATFSRDGIVRGIRKGVPLAVSGVPWGIAFGMLSREVDLTSIQAVFMSAFVYSGTGQMVAIDLWRAHGGMFAIWLAMILISIRYIMFGLVMRPWFQEIPPVKTFSTLFLLSDQSWALMLSEHRAGRRDVGVLFGCHVIMLIGWLGGTIAGRFAGNAIPDPDKLGLGFLSTVVLVSMLSGMWQGRSNLLPWLAAAGSAVAASELIPGYYYILIGALVGTTMAVWLDRTATHG